MDGLEGKRINFTTDPYEYFIIVLYIKTLYREIKKQPELGIDTFTVFGILLEE